MGGDGRSVKLCRSELLAKHYRTHSPIGQTENSYEEKYKVICPQALINVLMVTECIQKAVGPHRHWCRIADNPAQQIFTSGVTTVARLQLGSGSEIILWLGFTTV